MDEQCCAFYQLLQQHEGKVAASKRLKIYSYAIILCVYGTVNSGFVSFFAYSHSLQLAFQCYQTNVDGLMEHTYFNQSLHVFEWETAFNEV